MSRVHFVWKGTLPETNSLHLKIDGWKTILSFWDLLPGKCLVSFRECKKNPRLENQSRCMLLLFCFGMLMFNVVFTVRTHTFMFEFMQNIYIYLYNICICICTSFTFANSFISSTTIVISQMKPIFITIFTPKTWQQRFPASPSLFRQFEVGMSWQPL